jgi:hypothetical protein
MISCLRVVEKKAHAGLGRRRTSRGPEQSLAVWCGKGICQDQLNSQRMFQAASFMAQFEDTLDILRSEAWRMNRYREVVMVSGAAVCWLAKSTPPDHALRDNRHCDNHGPRCARRDC